MTDMHTIMSLDEDVLNNIYDKLISKLSAQQISQINQNINIDESNDRLTESLHGVPLMTDYEIGIRRKQYFLHYADWVPGQVLGGNKKNKPKIYKNKIIQGKERNIYKIPGSRKDYIKYKGAFIAVNDYIKSKNK